MNVLFYHNCCLSGYVVGVIVAFRHTAIPLLIPSSRYGILCHCLDLQRISSLLRIASESCFQQLSDVASQLLSVIRISYVRLLSDLRLPVRMEGIPPILPDK